MSMTYRTREGDMLDWICWKHYRRTAGTVEAVYEANRGLAASGMLLPAGLLITLPDIAEPDRQTLPRLWG